MASVSLEGGLLLAQISNHVAHPHVGDPLVPGPEPSELQGYHGLQLLLGPPLDILLSF